MVPAETSLQKPPHVLWLASWYPNRYDRFSGDFIQRAAKALSLFAPVTVLHIYRTSELTSAFEEEIIQQGALTEHIIYYNPGKRFFKVFDQFNSNRRFMQYGKAWLKQYLAQHSGKHIVEVAIAMRMGLLALWLKHNHGIPFHVQEHWTGYYKYLMPPELRKPIWWWRLNDRILKNANHLLPDSRDLGRILQKQFPRLHYTEMPNAVNTEHFYYTGAPHGPFTFLHVSTMTHQKNTEAIIEAFTQMHSTHPQCRLLLIGPPTPSVLEAAQIANLPSSALSFKGSLSYEEVAEHMRKAHALVLFSRYENLPCVMLEAWCCGVPVIASNVGGIQHHLHPANGILVESENEMELRDAMMKIVEDQARFNRAEIAAHAAQNYSFQTMGSAWLHVYKLIYPHLFKKPLKSGI